MPPMSALVMTEPESRKPLAVLFKLVCKTLWIVACILTLGYGKESHDKIMKWKKSNLTPTTASDPKDLEGLIAKTQRKEYDRLTMPLSVITATSAAALAIPSPFGGSDNKIHWLATAFYSGAFGLSLGGIFILMYLTAFISDLTEDADLLVTGPDFEGKAKPFAIILALPTTITTYSSAFLLIGLVVMTIAADQKGDIGQHMLLFKMIVLVPVFLPLVCLATAIVACKIFKKKLTEAGNKIGKAIGTVLKVSKKWIESLTEHAGAQVGDEPAGETSVSGLTRELKSKARKSSVAETV